ncbi:MAG: hypothetical protein DRJ63_00160 [Thermoprotei archaeon]|nr:MAG: hypothetical protein DRJ63_00160 [Thermoprotei archaeon]
MLGENLIKLATVLLLMLFDTRPIYVFDVDGVLVDVSEKISVVMKKLKLDARDPEDLDPKIRSRFWRLFLSEDYIIYDKPREIGIDLLLDRLKKGRVVVVTGRPASLRRATILELKSFGLPVSQISFFFRRKGDFRKDYEYKCDVIKSLVNVIEVHDDSVEVLEALSRILKNTKLYLHFDDSFTLFL